jgi:hypothetical protein
MLVIVESFVQYRHYFEGLGNRTTVYSDHKNLLWFTETKLYNRRQARWAEKLAQFDFLIIFRPGKQGGKPDALSRRPDYTAGLDDKEERTMTFLKPEQIDTSLIDGDPTLPAYSLNLGAVRELFGTDDERVRTIINALPTDPEVGPYLHYLRSPDVPRPDDVAEYLRPFSLDEDKDLLLRDGLVYVPALDALKAEILKTATIPQQPDTSVSRRPWSWYHEIIIGPVCGSLSTNLSTPATPVRETRRLVTPFEVNFILSQFPEVRGNQFRWIS